MRHGLSSTTASAYDSGVPNLRQFQRVRGQYILSEIELSETPAADPLDPPRLKIRITSGAAPYTATMILIPPDEDDEDPI